MDQSLQVRLIDNADTSAYHALRMRSLDGLVHAAEPQVLRELGIGAAGMVGLLLDYEDEGTQVWGVFDDSVLAGVVCLSRTVLQQSARIAQLWGVFVLPRYRGTAASRLMMDAVLQHCEAEPDTRELAVEFAGSNVLARQFFERFGFELLPYDTEEQIAREGVRTIRMRRWIGPT